MKLLLSFFVQLVLLQGCENEHPNIDAELTENLKPSYALHEQNITGNIAEVIDSMFVYDSSGTMLKDSVYMYHTFYENNMAVRGIEMDSPAVKLDYRLSYTNSGNYLNSELRKGDSVIETGAYRYDSISGLGSAVFTRFGKISDFQTDALYNNYQKLQFVRVLNADSSLNLVALFTYDKWNLIAGKHWDSTGTHVLSGYYQLNEYGDRLRDSILVWRNNKKRLHIKRYQYPTRDQHQNWTQKIQTDSSGKPLRRTARKIKYLD